MIKWHRLAVPFVCSLVCSTVALWCQSTIPMCSAPPWEWWMRWTREGSTLPMDTLNSVAMPTNCAIYPIPFVQTSILSVVRRVAQLLRYCKIYSFCYGHWHDGSVVCRQWNRYFSEWNGYHNISEMSTTPTTETMRMMRWLTMMSMMIWSHCSLCRHFVCCQFSVWHSPLPNKMHDISRPRRASFAASRALGRPHRTNGRIPMEYKLRNQKSNYTSWVGHRRRSCELFSYPEAVGRQGMRCTNTKMANDMSPNLWNKWRDSWIKSCRNDAMAMIVQRTEYCQETPFLWINDGQHNVGDS